MPTIIAWNVTFAQKQTNFHVIFCPTLPWCFNMCKDALFLNNTHNDNCTSLIIDRERKWSRWSEVIRLLCVWVYSLALAAQSSIYMILSDFCSFIIHALFESEHDVRKRTLPLRFMWPMEQRTRNSIHYILGAVWKATIPFGLHGRMA